MLTPSLTAGAWEDSPASLSVRRPSPDSRTSSSWRSWSYDVWLDAPGARLCVPWSTSIVSLFVISGPGIALVTRRMSIGWASE